MRCLLSGAHNSWMSVKVWNKETTPGPGLDAIQDLHLSSRTLCTAPDKALNFSLIMKLTHCWSLYVFGRGETMQPDVSERQCLLWNDKRADCQMFCFRKKMAKLILPNLILKVDNKDITSESERSKFDHWWWMKSVSAQGSRTEERSGHRVGAADSSQSLNHRSKGTHSLQEPRRAVEPEPSLTCA